MSVAKMAGPAFLCSWRRSMLVDALTAPSAFDVGGAPRRLILSDVLDPSLKWDLIDYLVANLPPDTLLLSEEDEATLLGGGSDFPPAHQTLPLPLAQVDFICTGRAFALLYALHAPLREEGEEGEGGEGQRGSQATHHATTAGEDGRYTPLEVLLLRCNVFARMSPQNKQELMRCLQVSSCWLCIGDKMRSCHAR